MIRVEPLPEPLNFEADVRSPGNEWLRNNPGAKRPPALWLKYISDLADGFRDRCAYAAMYVPEGTVYHFLSYKNHPELTYEWGNYRFSAGTLNSSKKTVDGALLDPYEIEDGWFEIILPSLQLRLTDAVPAAMRDKAEYTLKRLKLRDGERVLRWRRSWYALYQSGELTLDGLRRVAPLIANAVEKVQG